MNLIVERLISQPHDAAPSIEQPVNEPIETKLGERAAPLGSNSIQTIALRKSQQVIDWLSDHNFPALPVAPQQDAYKYHKVVKAQILREVWSHCPLTENHKPIPVYTGKNPSYLDSNGQPHLVNHRRYQNQLPLQTELKHWFANPANGVGTLGGWNDAVWLDFDVKNFASQQQCDRCVDSILAQPELQGTFVGRTHSGGWRVGVSVKPKPDFTNFALSEEGAHVGEALGAGRFTVLHGMGVSGNPYQILNCAALVEVESLRNIGIYPTKANKQQPQKDELVRQKVSDVSGTFSGRIELEILGNPTSRAILGGDCPSGDRSGALASAVQEWYGWELWASENGVLISGSAETLAHHAGSKLGIDSDRVERILKTINPGECKPAALYRGGEDSCWKKIYRLDKTSYEANCPAHIRDALAFEWKLQNGGGNRGFGGNGGNGGGSGSNGGNQQPEDPDLVGNNTVESHVFDRLFEGGTGKIRTLEDCFYLYSGRGYWKKVADKAILKAIGLKLKHAYKLAGRGKGIFQDFPFFTEAKKKSTFLLCRDTLDLGEIPANNHLRCFLNCAVDLRTGEPVPHQPDHFLTTAIAAEYHANASCPEIFRDFITSSFGSDSIEYVRALTSMLLDPTAPYGKFIHALVLQL